MAKKNFEDVFVWQEVSKNAMTINADTCGKEGWWSDSCEGQNLTYIHYVEDWVNLKLLENGSVKLNEIREKFGLPPVTDDVTIWLKPKRDNSQKIFDIFVIDERDTGNGLGYVVDIE